MGSCNIAVHLGASQSEKQRKNRASRTNYDEAKKLTLSRR